MSATEKQDYSYNKIVKECPVCHLEFRQSGLGMHMRKHKQVEEIKTRKKDRPCPHCGRMFSAQGLAVHLPTHQTPVDLPEFTEQELEVAEVLPVKRHVVVLKTGAFTHAFLVDGSKVEQIDVKIVEV